MFEVTCETCGETFSSDIDLAQHQFIQHTLMKMVTDGQKGQVEWYSQLYWQLKRANIYKIMELQHCSLKEAFDIDNRNIVEIRDLQIEFNKGAAGC